MPQPLIFFSDHPAAQSGLARITREDWRPVVGYEGIYEVSSEGHVRRCDGHPNSHGAKILGEFLGNRGYFLTWLYREGIKNRYLLHALVAAAFHGPRPKGYEIDHIDCIKTHNAASNLEYVSKLENLKRQNSNRLHAYGEKNHTAILTKDEVEAIRQAHSTGVFQRVLAEKYNTTQSNIHKIVNRKTWA